MNPETHFFALIRVEAETQEQVNQVLAERLDHDEDYGFDYKIEVVSIMTAEKVID